MARPPPSIAQRSAQKLRFDHKDMDFYFAWSMSRAIYGGSDQQDCFDLIAVDLPGQGATPDLGLVFEACMGPAVAAVTDAALVRGDVDPERWIGVRNSPMRNWIKGGTSGRSWVPARSTGDRIVTPAAFLRPDLVSTPKSCHRWRLAHAFGIISRSSPPPVWNGLGCGSAVGLFLHLIHVRLLRRRAAGG
jgi:hypothetical protein